MEKENFLPWQVDARLVMQSLKTDAGGLSLAVAEKRLQRFGANSIEDNIRLGIWSKLFNQIKSPMVLILVVALLISIFLKEYVDAWVILAVIVMNTLIGFLHEYRVERSVRALKKSITPFATVRRAGAIQRIKTSLIVPGDIVVIEEGDKIPADGRVIEAKNLKVTESMLTGESSPAFKSPHTINAKAALADRMNMVWSGTFVSSGTGLFVVTNTGNRTVFGQIAESLKVIKKSDSVFTKKISGLARQAGLAAIVLIIVIFSVALFWRTMPFKETFLFSMASLVSIIPEGMIALFSIILAIGAKRMARKKAIIKNLPATETLGSVSTIITDKTGTLTQNVMMVEKIVDATGEIFGVSGIGFDPTGLFHNNGKIILSKDFPRLEKILRVMAVCNNAIVRKNNENIWETIGEPTEAALVVASAKAGFSRAKLEEEEFKIDAPPFDGGKKYREVLIENTRGERLVYIVGAPEKVLERCSMTFSGAVPTKLSAEKKQVIASGIDDLADAGLRTIAAAFKKVDKKTYDISSAETSGMTYLGVAGIKDPVRPGVADSIAKANLAGIRIIMATGDHKKTAIAVARELGIPHENAITENELSDLSPKEFEKVVETYSIFARVEPATKLKIAEVLQRRGEIVAMTGDGINDAPALKRADIGIAMGVIGTDVAREASQMILTDDNFKTIIDAVEEGRLVFRNVQKVGAFLVSTNLAEGLAILGTLVAGFPLPLLPTQILWLNLVTDTLAGFPLAAELPHENLLRSKPRDFRENILAKRTAPFMILMVVVMVVGALLIFRATLPLGVAKARTFTFLFIATSQLFNTLNLRSLSKSIFQMSPFGNRYLVFGLGAALVANTLLIFLPELREIFHMEALTVTQFFAIMGISFSVVVFAEIYKVLKRRFSGRNSLV